MDIDAEFRDKLFSVIKAKCAKELERLLRLQCPSKEHLALKLDFIELVDHDPGMADALIRNPRTWLAQADKLFLDESFMAPLQHEALSRLDPAFIAAHEAAVAADRPSAFKQRLHLRIEGLSAPSGWNDAFLYVPVGRVRSEHMNKLVLVSGTVIRTGGVKMCKSIQWFQCSRCRHEMLVRCKLEDGGVAPAPESCSNPKHACPGTKFTAPPNTQEFTGFQEIKMQEKSACMTMGAVPSSLPVVLQDELVDQLQCGDDIEVLGVVTPRWQPMFPNQRVDVDLVLVANNVRVISKKRGRLLELPASAAEKFQAFWNAHARNPLCARNKMIAGICPQIHGMFLVKLAVALALVGGIARPEEHLRGDVHLLLIGDPGIGKSQIMKFAARAAHRSVTTSGRATTGAGLTAAAIKDGSTWSLEGGALVLADGGVCCIDEFDGIKDGDRAMMHEAMEQQTVHVAKAGIVATLPTRTTVVASVNPKPGWKPSQPLLAATNISGPLLSRFDIVLLLLDVRHEQRDRLVADRVLENHQQGARRTQQDLGAAGGGGETAGGGGQRGVRGSQGAQGAITRAVAPAERRVNRSTGDLAGPVVVPTQQLEGTWSLEALRLYLVWVKQHWQPVMTDDAEKVLQAYYQVLRQNEERSAARTTVRMLESLVRIAQAHARLCARSQVRRQDAVVSVLLVDASQGVLRVLGQDAPLSSEFPVDPDSDYQVVEQRVMRELGLSQLMALPAPPGAGEVGGRPALLPAPPGGVYAGQGKGGWQALRAVLAPQAVNRQNPT